MHQTFSANLQEKVQCETYIMHVFKKRGAYAYQTCGWFHEFIIVFTLIYMPLRDKYEA